MAIIPKNGILSNSQAITAAAASTNYYDTGLTTPQGQIAKNYWIGVRVNTVATDTSDTVSIELQHDADDGAGSPVGTWATVCMPFSGAAGAEVACTDDRLAAAGTWVCRFAVPPECNLRYWRLYYNNTTSNGTQTYDAALYDGVPGAEGTQVVASNVGTPAVV